MKSFADQCFDASAVWVKLEDELFEGVNKILGCETSDCAKEAFTWGALSTGIDYYDSSVEVVRPPKSGWMSQEQVNAILALGFSIVFESIGDKARRWGPLGFSECHPQLPSEEERLRAMITALKAKT